MDGDLVLVALERPHGAVRVRGGSVLERDPHAEVVLHGPVARVEQQRRGRLVAGRDELAQHGGAALERPLLGVLAQRAADPAPAGVGVDVDQRVVAQQQRGGDDPAARLLDHPRVALEVQPGRGPVGVQVLDREVRVADVRDVARQQHAQDGLVVGGARRRRMWSLGSVATWISTGVPTGTRGYRSITSGTVMRMQPCDAREPIEPGSPVPWMPTPLTMPIQRALSGFSAEPPATVSLR